MLLLMASKSLTEYISFSNSLVDITTDAYIESKEVLAMTEVSLPIGGTLLTSEGGTTLGGATGAAGATACAAGAG